MYRNIFLVGGWTVASRLTGFLRDMALAALLGGGALDDAYVAAIKLPNQFRQIFGEGSFNAAYLPTYTRVLEAGGPEEAGRFASQVFTLLILSQVALLCLVYLDMPLLVRLTSPGFVSQPEKFAQAVAMSRVMFPYIAFIAVFALHQGTLNANNTWGAPASAPAAANVCMIAFLGFAALFPKVSPENRQHGELGISRLRRYPTRHRHGRRAPARPARAADLAALDARNPQIPLDAGAGDRHFRELSDRRARRPDCGLAFTHRRSLRHQLRRSALSIARRGHRYRHRLGAAQGNVGPRRPWRRSRRARRSKPGRFTDAGARRSLHRGLSSHSQTSSSRSPSSTAPSRPMRPSRPLECLRLMRLACRLCWSTGSPRRAFCRAATPRRRSRSRWSASPSMWRSRSRCFGRSARRAWRWRPRPDSGSRSPASLRSPAGAAGRPRTPACSRPPRRRCLRLARLRLR